MEKRPRKRLYSKDKIKQLRDKAVEKVKSKFLPNEKIIKIYLIGSSVKDCFGVYESPGFRGSLYSDFDFIIFVEDDYDIPQWLEREPEGRPFSSEAMNAGAYRSSKFIDDTYDIEIFFIRKKDMLNEKIQKEGELAGIPMSEKSTNKYVLVFRKKDKVNFYFSFS